MCLAVKTCKHSNASACKVGVSSPAIPHTEMEKLRRNKRAGVAPMQTCFPSKGF